MAQYYHPVVFLTDYIFSLICRGSKEAETEKADAVRGRSIDSSRGTNRERKDSHHTTGKGLTHLANCKLPKLAFCGYVSSISE